MEGDVYIRRQNHDLLQIPLFPTHPLIHTWSTVPGTLKSLQFLSALPMLLQIWIDKPIQFQTPHFPVGSRCSGEKRIKYINLFWELRKVLWWWSPYRWSDYELPIKYLPVHTLFLHLFPYCLSWPISFMMCVYIPKTELSFFQVEKLPIRN